MNRNGGYIELLLGYMVFYEHTNFYTRHIFFLSTHIDVISSYQDIRGFCGLY